MIAASRSGAGVHIVPTINAGRDEQHAVPALQSTGDGVALARLLHAVSTAHSTQAAITAAVAANAASQAADAFLSAIARHDEPLPVPPPTAGPPPGTVLPSVLHQATFQEARTLGWAIADGPTGRGWQANEGEIALRHKRPGQTMAVKLAATPHLEPFWAPPRSRMRRCTQRCNALGSTHSCCSTSCSGSRWSTARSRWI